MIMTFSVFFLFTLLGNNVQAEETSTKKTSRTFEQAMKHRRSHYALEAKIPVSDDELKRMVDEVVLHVPSAFNMQSTRIVILLGENHKTLWKITKDIAKKTVPPEKFSTLEARIDSFAAAYGTILFYEDQTVVEEFQKKYSDYKDNFPLWSRESSAMHQFALWTMLCDAEMGCSLQHFSSMIEETVAKTWKIDPRWKMMAQMPFGTPTQEPGKKEFQPLEKRVIMMK